MSDVEKAFDLQENNTKVVLARRAVEEKNVIFIQALKALDAVYRSDDTVTGNMAAELLAKAMKEIQP